MPTSTYPGTTLALPCFQAVYKGCTRDAHRVYQLKIYELPVGISCTPLVHDVVVRKNQCIWMKARLGRNNLDFSQIPPLLAILNR